MAALTSTGVTVNDYWYIGARVGSKRKSVDVTLALVSQGGLTNNIPATLFGLTTIESATLFVDSSSNQYQAAPSWDKTKLVFTTDATANTPADQTATVRGVVTGKE